MKVKFIALVGVDTENGPVYLEVFEDETGGLFAVDSSYLDQVTDEVFSPFTGKLVVCPAS